MNPGHQPQRFQIYKQLQDGTGFTIDNQDYIYLFDRYGGWFDQYGNYYNQNGEADDPPSDQQDQQSSEDQEEEYSQSDSYQDQFQSQFGRPHDHSDDEQDNEATILASIALNLQHLKEYPPHNPLRVYFNNLHPKQNKQVIFNTYLLKVKGLLNLILHKTSTNKLKGTGAFIVSNTSNAQDLILLQAKKILSSKELYFQVAKYEDYLLEPLKEEDLTFHPEQKFKKRFVLKQPQNSVDKQEEKAKIQVVWRWYKFQKAIFPKKSHLKQWMIQNGFNYQQDFKNVQKIQGDSTNIKLQMKESTFASVNGLFYYEKKVQFLPL